MKVLKPSYRNLSTGDLKQMAKGKVNDLLTIGRSEGSTSGKRLQDIAGAAKDVGISGQIFKDIKTIPDEVARLMGRIEDPKNIILNTVNNDSRFQYLSSKSGDPSLKYKKRAFNK